MNRTTEQWVPSVEPEPSHVDYILTRVDLGSANGRQVRLWGISCRETLS